MTTTTVKINLGKDSSGRPLVVDTRTLAKLRRAEKRLKVKFTIVQGSYRAGNGAAASGETHDEGGVIDLRVWDLPKGVSPQQAVKELRLAGFIAWYRPLNWDGHNGGAHIHAIDYGNPALAPAAARQVAAWKAGKNGLANGRPDTGARVKVPANPRWIKAATPAPPPPPPPSYALQVDGVDISNWQTGTINYAAAKAAGVRFVIHKATQGTKMHDLRYNQRRREVAAAGLVWGSYHFGEPSASPVAQARAYVKFAAHQPGDMRPILDLEKTGGLTPAQLTAWTGAWVGEVVRLTGQQPIIYTNQDLSDSFGCVLWVARYHNTNAAPRIPKPWKGYAIRQFSNGKYGTPNRVPGFNFDTDLNTLSTGLFSKRTPEAALAALRIPTVPKHKAVKPPKAKAKKTPNLNTYLDGITPDMVAALKRATTGAVPEAQAAAKAILAANETLTRLRVK